jgi:hypothetical protein
LGPNPFAGKCEKHFADLDFSAAGMIDEKIMAHEACSSLVGIITDEKDQCKQVQSRAYDVECQIARRDIIHKMLLDLRNMLLTCLVDYSPIEALDQIIRYDSLLCLGILT